MGAAAVSATEREREYHCQIFTQEAFVRILMLRGCCCC